MGRGKFFPLPLRLVGILFSGWGCEASFLMPFFLLSGQVRPVFCFLLWKSEFTDQTDQAQLFLLITHVARDPFRGPCFCYSKFWL